MKLNNLLQVARLPVVLIHGLFGSLNNLGVLAYSLGENYRTLQIDLRNHGMFSHAPTISYKEMVQDVPALLDALLIKSCIVIGHSMGATWRWLRRALCRLW